MTEFTFNDKITKTKSKGFLLIVKLYNNPNGVDILVPKKQKMEGKAAMEPHGSAVNK